MIDHTNNDLAMIRVADFAELDLDTVRRVFRAIEIADLAVIDSRKLLKKSVELPPTPPVPVRVQAIPTYKPLGVIGSLKRWIR